MVPGGYTEDEGATAAEKLLAEPLPTAVIAANDPCAVGILDTVLQAGLTVPGELSVVGTTTPASAACPVSTSPPSVRTSRGWPGSPSKPSSTGSTDPPANPGPGDAAEARRPHSTAPPRGTGK
jgi:Periplasmic binding protein-like domain